MSGCAEEGARRWVNRPRYVLPVAADHRGGSAWSSFRRRLNSSSLRRLQAVDAAVGRSLGRESSSASPLVSDERASLSLPARRAHLAAQPPNGVDRHIDQLLTADAADSSQLDVEVLLRRGDQRLGIRRSLLGVLPRPGSDSPGTAEHRPAGRRIDRLARARHGLRQPQPGIVCPRRRWQRRRSARIGAVTAAGSLRTSSGGRRRPGRSAGTTGTTPGRPGPGWRRCRCSRRGRPRLPARRSGGRTAGRARPAT
jgi:hypothetical protein